MPPAAVIVPAGGSVATTAEAVERQTRAPSRVIAVDTTASLDGAVREALGAEPSWVWVLDGGVLPEPQALERLLAAAEDTPSAALLVSKVITPDGALDRASLPVPEVHRGDVVVDALTRRAVPLRIARRGSMLVGGEAARQLDADTIERDLEWTARVLKRGRGLLVPESVAIRTSSGDPPGRSEVSASLRALAALEPRERLWFAVYFGQRALARRRRARA
jgi:hypothetical protein